MRRLLILLLILAALLCSVESCNTGEFAGSNANGELTCPPGTTLGDNGAGRPVCWR